VSDKAVAAAKGQNVDKARRKLVKDPCLAADASKREREAALALFLSHCCHY
jgi:hypothetical protein